MSAAPKPEPGTQVAPHDPLQHALAERNRMRAVQKEIRNKSWGKDLPGPTVQAMILWAERRGIDAATEIDVLGGNIHLKGTYYLRRLAQMIGAGRILYARADHVHVDPRLAKIAGDEQAPPDIREDAKREGYRRTLERARYNLKDEAAAAVVYRIKVEGMEEEIVGAKHCGNGVKKNDPVGDASPPETCETRAARRACRQLIDTFPDLKAEMDVIEAEAKLVSVEIVAGQSEIRKRLGLPPVKSGGYDDEEVMGAVQGATGGEPVVDDQAEDARLAGQDGQG